MSDETVNKYLEVLVKDLESKAEDLQDEGHKHLIVDLTTILSNALIGNYHDFHKNGLPAPKIAMHNELMDIDKKMQNGHYDN